MLLLSDLRGLIVLMTHQSVEGLLDVRSGESGLVRLCRV